MQHSQSRLCTRFSNCFLPVSSNALVGSSKRITEGRVESAMAHIALCASPPESLSQFLSKKGSVRPSASRKGETSSVFCPKRVLRC
mmetsp:Transcript_51292/g.136903  ORF Transcript_51292/g.136903 Transcript_51292/m.136903 type:complete len:86 (+) Transcript_51292:159-416(+)